jgi:hypothetical protein
LMEPPGRAKILFASHRAPRRFDVLTFRRFDVFARIIAANHAR